MIKAFLYFSAIFALTANGVFVEVAGARVTPGRALGLVLLLAILGRSLWRGKFDVGGAPGILIIFWLLLGLCVDLFEPGRSVLLRHWLNSAAAITWFFVVVGLRPKWPQIQAGVSRVGAVLGSLAVVVMLALALLPTPPSFITQLVLTVGGQPRLQLLSWEPNIFGAVVAVSMMLLLPSVLTVKQRSVRRRLIFILLAVALLGSLSKGPWLAFAAALGVYVALTHSGRALVAGTFLGIAAVASLLVFQIVAPESLATDITRSHNVIVRLVHIRYALIDVAKSPIFGNGSFSLGVLWPSLNAQFGTTGAWVGQTLISVLHDTGAVGLLLYLSYLVALFGKAVRANLRAHSNQWTRDVSLISAAVISAGSVMLVMGLATTLYALPIYWAVLGLVACVPQWMREQRLAAITTCTSQ